MAHSCEIPDQLEMLRFEAQRLALALESAGQGVWDHNLVTGVAYFSDTWKRMRGYGPEDDVELLAGPWLERLHPEDGPRILDTIERQNSGELDVNAFEYRERHRDGHWIWILSRGRPIEWLPDGRVACILGTDTDISVLKAAELALAEEKERLLVTLSSIADGLIAVDVHAVITNINSAACAITGWSAETAVGKPVADVLDIRSVADTPLIEPLLRQAFSQTSGIMLPDDTILVRSDGLRGRAHCSISPVIANGITAGLVVVFRDSTQEHEFKAQLQHSATHDPLTDLPNRLAFDRAFENAVFTALHERRQHMLCLIDLDGFKAINDGAGHAAGDEVLKAVAASMLHCCRASDIVARLGGDEFAIILKDIEPYAAHQVCDRLTEAVASLPIRFEGRSYRIGASAGIKCIDGDEESMSKLMSAADKACYLAKSLGKGQWVSADFGHVRIPLRQDA